MKHQDRAIIESVAEQFSAAWEHGDRPPDAWLKIGETRIAIAIAAIATPMGNRAAVRPRLRFDKEVLRLVADLQARLSDAVPDGEAVLVTVSAPIRQGAKTAAALVETIRPCLKRRPARGDVNELIYENQIRFRIVKTGSARTGKVVGFVHNPDPDADLVLLDGAEALLAALAVAAKSRALTKFRGDWWLVIDSRTAAPSSSIWTRIYAQLCVQESFNKVLMISGGGKVAVLGG